MTRALAKKETDERARRAVAEFRKVQHTLTSFARVLTGKNDVSVEMHATSNGHTDGKKIYYRPNLALGDELRHDTTLCDRRDPDTGQQQCGACKAREQMMATIYHEISHIAFETFIEPGSDHVKEAMKFARDVTSKKFWERTMKRMVRTGNPKSYQELANGINPYLAPLVNALEDVRINERMHEARPGTRAMMEALITEVAIDGVPGAGGVVKHWREMHPNHQAGVAAYCYAAGFDITGWFGDEVSRAFTDKKLCSLLSDTKYCHDAHETFQNSFDVFVRFRELGFFELKEEREADEKEAEEQEQEEEQTEEEQQDVPTPPVPTPPKPDAKSDESEPEEDGEDESEDGSGSDAHDEGGQADGEPGGDEDSSEPDDQSAGSDVGEDESEEPQDGSSDESAPGDDTADAQPEPDDSGDAEGAGDGSGDDEDGSSGSPSEPGEGEAADDGAGSPGGMGEASSESADEEEPDLEGEGDESGSGEGSADHGEDAEGVDPIEYTPEEAIDNTDGETPDYRIDPDEEAERTIPTLVDFGIHSPEEKMSSTEASAVETAIIQGIYFEQPSSNIKGVNEWSYENAAADARRRSWHGWTRRSEAEREAYGMSMDPVPESALAPALMRMRIVFAENKRTKRNRNQRAGRIDARVLGKRAWGEDDRLFGRKTIPAKRDYFVLIGLDISGSTAGHNLKLIKEAAMAQADLCARIGVKFAVYAHTGSPTEGSPYGSDLSVDIYHIKDADEMWDNKTKQRLLDIGPSYANLDGHTLEYYRKLMDSRTETDKVILYYSDGAMPAENYQEELRILQREIRTCVQKGYTLLGVGIRTDDPVKHGLPSVRVDSPADNLKVVTQLERTLTA